MKHVLAPLLFCLVPLSVTACKQQATGLASQAPTEVNSNELAAGTAPLPQQDEPTMAVSVEPGHMVGRFGLANDVFDLKAVDHDDDKVFDLKNGGRYVFTGGVVIPRVEGNWALEEDGKRLRITPDQVLPESGEMLFAITSTDTLRLLNLDGSPTSGSSGLMRIKP